VNYHDTAPTTPGDYKACSHYDSILSLSQSGKWWDHADERLQDHEVEQQLPLIGPLPATQEQAIALACEVAFARMWLAGNVQTKFQQWDTRIKLFRRFNDGERTLELLRDMERVTAELTKK